MTARSTSSPVHLVTTAPHSHRRERGIRAALEYERERADRAEADKADLERALAAVFAGDGDTGGMPAAWVFAWQTAGAQDQCVTLPDGTVVLLDADCPAGSDPVREWRQLAALLAPKAVS